MDLSRLDRTGDCVMRHQSWKFDDDVSTVAVDEIRSGTKDERVVSGASLNEIDSVPDLYEIVAVANVDGVVARSHWIGGEDSIAATALVNDVVASTEGHNILAFAGAVDR